MSLEKIQRLIVDVPNFPKPGILFKDITPLLADSDGIKTVARMLAEMIPANTTKLVAVESRGFLLGAAVAQHVPVGLVLVRKPGKLPRPTLAHSYQLEYGSDTLQIHRDDLTANDRVVIIDDVLATGGTAGAVEALCEKLGAQVLGSLFLMEIPFLKGRSKLKYNVRALMQV